MLARPKHRVMFRVVFCLSCCTGCASLKAVVFFCAAVCISKNYFQEEH